MSDSPLPSAPPVISTDDGEQRVKQEDAQSSNDSSAIAKSASPQTKLDSNSGNKQKEEEDVQMSDALSAPDLKADIKTNGNNHDDAAAESEAETLIESPVKRREAEKLVAARQQNKPTKSRIGSLPVPADDDEDTSTPASPVQSVETGDLSRTPGRQVTRSNMREAVRPDDYDSSSDALSSPRSPNSHAPSQVSSRSRAQSEKVDASPNPRKRKHRASSVSLPNKRQSMEAPIPKRTTRGTTADHQAEFDGSSSPKLRSHRRAVSTQSALNDRANDNQHQNNSNNNNRKRRGHSQIPNRDSKGAKAVWEESDASSETASHGHADSKRLPRGIGRSTPGRQGGREHKRHVNKYGFTRLAEACESGDLEAVKEWLVKDREQLELAEFAQNKPLQIAALNGNDEIVSYLIGEGCQIDCANVDKDTPLIDAAENGHLETVKILLRAGVNPMRQNLKGQQALDVVTDETDDADAIRAVIRDAIVTWGSDGAKQRLAEEEFHQRHQASTSKGLQFMAFTYENLLKLVTLNDRSGVRVFLDARVPVDNGIITAAAKTGDLWLVNMLLAEMTEKKSFQKAERPVFAALGTSHFDMVKLLTELDQFNPLYRSRAGKTWFEIAEEKNGPNVEQERDLLEKLYNTAMINKARRSSSPVTKRDAIKRRSNSHRYPDDSAEDEEPEVDRARSAKRKNGRRLMSRRDMRAASGKGVSESESESDSSSSEGVSALTEEGMRKATEMQPPISPKTRRESTVRQRTKSISSQKSELTNRARRKSSSGQDISDDVLPATHENPEAKSSPDKADEVMRDAGDTSAEGIAPDEAIQVELAAAEAKRLMEEEEAALAATAAEAKAEEERQAEEIRSAKEAWETAQAEAEAARRIEEEKKREAERLEQAANETKIRLRNEVLDALPSTLAHVLAPDSSFRYEGTTDTAYLLDHFSPLLLVKGGANSPQNSNELSDDDSWVVNLQAAPLLGKKGLELLFRHEDIGINKTFSQNWNTYSAFSAREQCNVDVVLKELARDRRDSIMDLDDEHMEGEMSFKAEMAQLAAISNMEKTAERKLRSGPLALYCVRLGDVLENLDPLLHDAKLKIRPLDWMRQSAAIAKDLDDRGVDNFVSRFADAFWAGGRTETREVNVKTRKDQEQVAIPISGVTKVTIVHEK